MKRSLIPTNPAELRANHFNTMRLAMALLVVWSHCFAIYYGTEDFEPISLILDGQYNAGNIGVRVFFAVSGFLIVQSWERSSSAMTYFSKRVRRIFPGYLVAVALCSFVVVPLYSSAGYSGVTFDVAGEWLWKNLLLRNYIPPSDAFATNSIRAVNGALWSIPFEFWCYIGVAVLGFSGLLRRRWVVLAALIALMIVKTWLDATGRKPGGGLIGDIIGWPYLWFSMAPSFLIGVVALKFGSNIPRSRWMLLALTGALILAAHAPTRIAFDLIFIPWLGYAVFYCAFIAAAIPDAAKHGDISYGTYLYGFPIQQMLAASATLSFPAFIAASVALSLVAGALSWIIVERNFTGSGVRRDPSRRRNIRLVGFFADAVDEAPRTKGV